MSVFDASDSIIRSTTQFVVLLRADGRWPRKGSYQKERQILKSDGNTRGGVADIREDLTDDSGEHGDGRLDEELVRG